MDVAILVAVVGLVGVIIGGLINTGTTILLDRRRDSEKAVTTPAISKGHLG
jgi:hypothetical protein